MNYLNSKNFKQSLLNHILNSKQTIFAIIDEKLNILEYNKCFSKLLGVKSKETISLNHYLLLEDKEEISFEKLISYTSQFHLYTQNNITLRFRCELEQLEENYLLIGEVEFTFDLNVIEKMANVTSELAMTTMELHKKNSQLDKAMKKIEAQHNMIVSQSRFVAINELTLMLAHQWRQPLSVINMYNNLLKMEIMELDNPPEDLNNYIEESEKVILQLSETIDLFTKNFEDQQVQNISINKTLKDTIKLLKPNFKTANVTVKKELNSKEMINLQPSTFMQIANIILQNSFDAFSKNHIEKRGIQINSYDEDNHVVIEFLDNAGGIDKDIIEKVFDPYFSTKEEKNNTGLGLYTANLLTCEILHGSIHIENKNDGVMVQIKLSK